MDEERPLAEKWHEAARKKGWPDGLLQRAIELRVPGSEIEKWLSVDWSDAGFAQRRIDWHERMTFGSIRGREATTADNEAFSDLFANSPEEIGEWEMTNERGPNAFAQFRLQENVSIPVIEEKGILIASCSFSIRNVVVGGTKLTVRYGQALRVRKEYRRQGFGDQVRSISWGVGTSRPSHCQYDNMRSQNYAVVNWWKKYVKDMFEDIPEREGDIPGISVTVLQYPARSFDGDGSGIRRVEPADVSRCVGLINRTHRGLDLFRPYSVDFLERRLNDGFWGEPMPEEWWPRVYGWQDYHVVEEQGRVVACAGLWDRGRDMRDRWRRKSGGEEKVLSTADVLDFGFARGNE
ncbi:MAG: hypothetical protein IIC89_00380, partial [Chloroflexi bacterium]|nr:hypothetical protein [Chloroflexota bacterium]